MRIVFCPAVAFIAFLLSGCAREQATKEHYANYPGFPSSPVPATAAAPAPSSSQKPTAASTGQKLIVTPTESLNGRVSRVNSNLRFVILTFPVGQMPVVNRHLNLYRQGLKVGEVSVTGPQRNDSIVADITEGNAETGDEARDN